MLPFVKINFKNGSLGGTTPMDDGVALALLPGFSGTVDCLSYDDFLDKTGGTENASVKAFFLETGGKSRLIAAAMPQEEALVDTVKNLLAEFCGDIRYVIVPGVSALSALTALQAVGLWADTELFAPVVFLVSLTSEFLSTARPGTFDLNRVAVVDSLSDSAGVPLLWYVAGRAARIPVQRSLARVKDGPVSSAEFYTQSGVLVSNLYSGPVHDKGFITVRRFQGKAGYYFSDDLMAAAAVDDYSLLPRRRTVDKAFRIAYNTMSGYIGDEIPVTSTGGIPASVCKNIENTLSRQIESLMTNEGNLGTDPGDPSDTGVKCYVNPDQNVVSTSRLDVRLSVKPYGYAKYITVNLGFSTEI